MRASLPGCEAIPGPSLVEASAPANVSCLSPDSDAKDPAVCLQRTIGRHRSRSHRTSVAEVDVNHYRSPKRVIIPSASVRFEQH